jgi:light-regulated signal transduction histidine kinase (bacteriophytochrome)
MPHIEADETQMLRLFENLIRNGLKYRSAESPRIKIHATHDGRLCEVFVEDNGIGFDQRFAKRIFRPFQRLHNRKEYEGTGMGLAISRKIAERHRGSITARSKPGDGATFIVTLPLKQPKSGT